MKNFLLGVAVALGAVVVLIGQRRREAERDAAAWAAATDQVD